MRNVYHNLNLQFPRLIVLYLLVYILYIYTPTDFELFRSVLSFGMFAILLTTIIAAISTITSGGRKNSRNSN